MPSGIVMPRIDIQSIRLAALATACLGATLTTPASAELSAVWALGESTKVKADELNHHLAAGNRLFDGQTISLVAARNETIAFQLVLQGGQALTNKIRVVLDELGPLNNQRVEADPDRYYVGRHIEIFEELYLDVRERSHKLAWSPASQAEPAGLLGPVPDPLVPLAARTISVPAETNRGFWIDLYVGPNAPAGHHEGKLQVLVDAQPCALPACQLTVKLEILNATLPDEPSAKTMVYFSGGEKDRNQFVARYLDQPESASAEAVEKLRERHFKLFRRHGLTAFIGKDDAPTDALSKRLSGQLFTPDNGYEGPGEGVGQDMYAIHTYGGSLNASEAATWSTFFAEQSQPVDYFLYVMDEPLPGAFAEVNAIAAAAEPVPTFVTHPPTPSLAVDIYATMPAYYNLGAVQAAAEFGKPTWLYNGNRPFSGSFVTDDVAISLRVNPWIQHKHGIERWFYWESTYYDDFQGSRGNVDVFSEAANFTNRIGDVMNGDGLLVYPGRDKIFPAQDRGLDVPLPSIRLKAWRRGLQDVAYLELARAAGGGQQVDALIAEMVPTALHESGGFGAPVSWSEDGDDWLHARQRLASWIRDAAPSCGNGMLDAGEVCDDGHTLAGDGCSPTCQKEAVPSSASQGGCASATHRNGSRYPMAAFGLLTIALFLRPRRDARSSH